MTRCPLRLARWGQEWEPDAAPGEEHAGKRSGAADGGEGNPSREQQHRAPNLQAQLGEIRRGNISKRAAYPRIQRSDFSSLSANVARRSAAFRSSLTASSRVAGFTSRSRNVTSFATSQSIARPASSNFTESPSSCRRYSSQGPRCTQTKFRGRGVTVGYNENLRSS